MKKQINYNDNKIKRFVIMDHYSSPRHKPIKHTKHSIVKRKNNISCMDDIIISMEKKDGKIWKCSFDGISCALATASTDILIDLVLNCTINDAKNILLEYKKMIIEGKTNRAKLLGETMVFIGTKSIPNRLNCVLMGADLLLELIESES